MKLSEANKIVKKLDSRLSFTTDEDNNPWDAASVELRCSGKAIAWIFDSEGVMNDKKDLFSLMDIGIEVSYKVIKLLIELHETPVAEREDERKYYVHIAKGVDDSYLNYGKGTQLYGVYRKESNLQTQFNKAEIDEMKKLPELAIDWNKALEEVPGDEVSDD